MGLRFAGGKLIVDLADGRRIITPLEHFPSLQNATAKERGCWEFLGWGMGIDWPYLDLQLSVVGIVAGRREHVTPPGWREKRDADLAAAGLDPIPSPEEFIAQYKAMKPKPRGRSRAR